MANDELKPIPFKGTKSLSDLPDIVLGAGVFNYQYHDDPHNLSSDAVLRRAFELGIRALDTSAYYGPSEEIVGKSLERLKADFPRESYFICTKAGRVTEHEFDYSPQSIRKSVERSLQRLNTKYIDVLYVHDVEFESTEHGLEAIGELIKLKQEGLARFIGVTGYPVDYLCYFTTQAKKKFGHPLDVVLSYSNFCLQNVILAEYADKFQSEGGVSKLITASPLSMSLLRSEGPLPFHPGSVELKATVQEVAKMTASRGVKLADLATRFVLLNWPGTMVFGLQTVEEVENAVKMYWICKKEETKNADKPLVEEVQKMLGKHMNETWPSGIAHQDMKTN